MTLFAPVVQRAMETLSRVESEFRRVPFVHSRYSNVPPEALSFLDSGADGCHYALFVDDPAAQTHEPPIVWVSPMDGPPETLWLVAANADEFATLIRTAGSWRGENEDLVRATRERALAVRASMITCETVDGLGVVAADAAAARALADARDRIARGL